MSKVDMMTDMKVRQGLGRFCWFMTRHRLAVLLSAILLAVFLGYGVVKLRGEVILQEMFPYDHPYLKLHARFARVFGSGASGVVIGVKAREGDIFKFFSGIS